MLPTSCILQHAKSITWRTVMMLGKVIVKVPDLKRVNPGCTHTEPLEHIVPLQDDIWMLIERARLL